MFTTGLLLTVATSSFSGDSDVLRDLEGRVIGEGAVDEALGGQFWTLFQPLVTAKAALQGTWEITLRDTGTTWLETFLIGVPNVPQSPAPMLVVFHGWGNTHWDIAFHTRYFQKAMSRGWLVVAPLGAHKFNFSIDYAQQNTEAALDWVLENFDVDRERIYGVGFSMGGGGAATYAARHLDPAHARFAAVVDHTGSVSIADVWANAQDKSLLEHDLMFQGPPTAYSFRYQRASVIDLNATGEIDVATDLARNLVHTPVMAFAVSGDPNAHLVTQSIALDSHLTGLGGDIDLDIDNGQKHSWSTLDENVVLDWLDGQRLTEPVPGVPIRVLADRTGVWHDLTVVQKTTGAFSPLRYTVDLANNRVVLDQVKNAESIAFHPGKTGLQFDPGCSVEVMLDLVGQMSLDVVLEGFNHAPSSVTRTGTSNASWTWNPARRVVVLHETHGTGYPRWTVTL